MPRSFQSPPKKLVEFEAVFSREMWRNKDEDSDHFTIASVNLPDAKKTVVIKGQARPGDLLPGVTYLFAGEWKKDKRGPDPFFQFSSFIRKHPHSRIGLVNYLAKFAPGIGPMTAGHLYDAYGAQAVSYLRTSPEAVHRDFPRLGWEKIKAAAQALHQLAHLEETRIALTELLHGRGFSHKLVDLLIERWGCRAPEIVSRDPYCLMVHGFPSCGFARCDRLYTDLGKPLGKRKRQLILLWHSIHTARGGDTWHEARGLAAKLHQLIGGAEQVNPVKAIRLGERAGWLLTRRDEAGTLWIAEGQQGRAEQHVAEKIAELMAGIPCTVEPEGATFAHQA